MYSRSACCLQSDKPKPNDCINQVMNTYTLLKKYKTHTKGELFIKDPSESNKKESILEIGCRVKKTVHSHETIAISWSHNHTDKMLAWFEDMVTQNVYRPTHQVMA